MSSRRIEDKEVTDLADRGPMTALVLGKGAKLAQGVIHHESNTELSDTVSSDRNAIGFVGLPYIRDAKALAITDGGSSPISPSEFTVTLLEINRQERILTYLRRIDAGALFRGPTHPSRRRLPPGRHQPRSFPAL